MVVVPPCVVHVKHLVVAPVPPTAEAEDEPAVAELVKQGATLSKINRVVQRGQHYRRTDANAGGAAQEKGCGGRSAGIDSEADEVMLGDPQFRVAQLFCGHGLFEGEVEDRLGCRTKAGSHVQQDTKLEELFVERTVPD